MGAAAPATDAFLRELRHATRGVLDPAAVIWEVVRRTGQHFGASRCLFAEIEPAQDYALVHRDYTDGVVSGVGRHRMELFGPPLIAQMKAGLTVVIEDVRTDPRTQGALPQAAFGALQIRSAVAVNLVQDGALVASLQLQHAQPRAWRPDEVRLLEQVAERSWYALETARATGELRENRDVLALAMRGGLMGAWSRRFPDGVWWSPELCEIHGITPEQAPRTEEESLRCVHPDDQEPFIRKLHEDVQARRDHISECRFRHGSGQWRWLEVRARAVYDETGRAVMLHGIAVDISARKAAELALRERESRYRSLVDASGAIVFTSDAHANWLEPNPSWEAFTGQSFDQYRGHGWAGAVHPEDVERIRRNVEASLAAGTTWTDEARVWHAPSASWRHQEARVVPIRSQDGAIRAWVGTVLDVHARKTAEEALRAADRRKDEFIATLAHELRNPLAPITNALALLERSPDPQAARSCRQIMSRQLRQMTRLVDDLLDVSRISSGRITLQRSPLALGEPLADAVQATRAAIDGRRQALELDLGPGAPRVLGDGARLAQVFTNLLGNASKFTPEDGRIAVRLRAGAGEAVVDIEDSGIGIPPERLEWVFEMFSQIDDGLARRNHGLGVGLTIARQLVCMHGGSIRAFSAGAGLGSRFEVRLPLLEACDAAVEASPDVPSLPAQRVLVVDDNRDSADSLAAVLELMGHAAQSAYDGPSALRLGESLAPQVVLLDIGMPGMHGYDVAARMRATPWGAGCVLVALTGWGQPSDKARAFAAGFDAHLVKPFDPAAFESVVQPLVGRRG